MKHFLLSLVVVLSVGVVGASAQYYPDGVPEGSAWIELATAPRLITEGPEAGNWEYVYDVYAGADTWLRFAHLWFDGSQVTNVWNGNELKQNWCAEAAGFARPFSGGFVNPEAYPSYWEVDPVTFEGDWVLPESPLPNAAWAMDNTWHEGSDYGQNTTNAHVWTRGTVDADGAHWQNMNPAYTNDWFTEGLSNTFRIVAPGEPGDIQYSVYMFQGVGGDAEVFGTITGPVPEPATMSLLALGGVALLRRKRK